MEMTIDESLEWLISRKEHYEMDDNCQELAKALDIAITTMHKYKKIEQILDDCDLEAWEVLEKVKEVVNNG
jgi:hypothetical protein